MKKIITIAIIAFSITLMASGCKSETDKKLDETNAIVQGNIDAYHQIRSSSATEKVGNFNVIDKNSLDRVIQDALAEIGVEDVKSIELTDYEIFETNLHIATILVKTPTTSLVVTSSYNDSEEWIVTSIFDNEKTVDENGKAIKICYYDPQNNFFDIYDYNTGSLIKEKAQDNGKPLTDANMETVKQALQKLDNYLSGATPIDNTAVELKYLADKIDCNSGTITHVGNAQNIQMNLYQLRTYFLNSELELRINNSVNTDTMNKLVEIRNDIAKIIEEPLR